MIVVVAAAVVVAAVVAAVAAVVAAAVAADTVASVSCTEGFAVDCFLMSSDSVRSVGRTVTFPPLDSNSFDSRTAAAHESGIFADSQIEASAAKQRTTIPWKGYCSSDIGSRNKKVAGRSVADGSGVTSDTFDTIPVSSFPRGYRLIVLGYKRACRLVSIPVSQGLPGLDLIDHRMRHCSKLGDGSQGKAGNHFQVGGGCRGRGRAPR